MTGLVALEAGAADARSILGDKAYGFCHDERYPLTEDEAAWCPHLPESRPPCPTFRAACSAPRAKGSPSATGTRTADTASETKRSRGDSGARGRGGDGSWDREAEPGTPLEAKPEPEVDVDEGALGPFAQVLMWLIVGGMLVALIVQIRGGGRRGSDAPAPAVAPEIDDEVGELPAIEDPTLTVDALLERAEARARVGDLAAAVSDGHAALIRRLAGRGRIHLDPSRTNGDHVRALREDPPLYAEVRDVVRVVERVQFGHTPVTRADVDGLLGRVRSALGRLAAALLLVWTGLACDDQPDKYPWSHSPSGAAGVIELLGDRGVDVRYRVEPLAGLDTAGPALIVKDNAGLSDDEWDALFRFVSTGGRAMIVGTKGIDVMFVVRAWARSGAVMEPLPGDRVSTTHTLVVPPGAGFKIENRDAFVLRADEEGTAYVAGREISDGFVLYLADDRLLTNGALAIADNGEYLARLIALLDRSAVEIVEGEVRAMSAGVSGASGPLDAVERADLTAPILQLLALVLLLYLWRGVHFGRPQDPPAPSRRRFDQHVDALARLYARAGARR
ncbi:MAG: DUF4350 domain-containing protein, partial [Myxococcales bacterium]|nr:DUF4350 domain-containing protein [Myxococcales bacterium]